jgi:membrane-bound lytic murein transglycosylase D
MKRIFSITLTVVIVIAAVSLLTFSSDLLHPPRDKDKSYREAFVRNYKIFSVKIPDKLDFAGEPVPLDNYYVRESLDRELLVNTYWHSNTILMFKRAYRWVPVMQPVLVRNGIPADFIFLCMVESGFENLISPAGATGYWQFMKSTGQTYGLEISEEVDERYHVLKSTEAACKYLKTAYAKFKNWTLAAASYNMGIDGLDRQLKMQKTDNYYDLQLNRETLRYVYRVLAVKTIYHNPVGYGLYLRETDLYPPIPTQPVAVDSTIENLADFAIKHKTPYRVLKELNPWILKNRLSVKTPGKYEILLPLNGQVSHTILMEAHRQDSILFNDTLHIGRIH